MSKNCRPNSVIRYSTRGGTSGLALIAQHAKAHQLSQALAEYFGADPGDGAYHLTPGRPIYAAAHAIEHRQAPLAADYVLDQERTKPGQDAYGARPP